MASLLVSEPYGTLKRIVALPQAGRTDAEIFMAARMNGIIEIIGYPGVGKLTVARELAEKTGLKLVDNHATNDPIFNVIGVDGTKSPPSEVWSFVEQARNIVLDVIERLASPEQGFVFTNVATDDEADRRLSARLQKVARARGAPFVPVLLQCEMEENKRRVSSPDRSLRYKLLDPAVLEAFRRSVNLLNYEGHPNRLSLDVTLLDPIQAAAAISSHLHTLGLMPELRP